MNAPYAIERDFVSLTVAWTVPSNAQVEAYELEMLVPSQEDAAWVSLSNTLKGNSIRKKNLVEGTAYNFRVRFRAVGEEEWSEFSAPSEDLFVVHSSNKVMEAPELASKDDISVTLQWKEVPGAGGYILRFRSDEDVGKGSSEACWSKIATTIKNTTVRKKGLEAGKSYHFSILPVDFPEGDEAVWSFSASSVACKVATMPPLMQKMFPTTLVTRTAMVNTSTLLSGKVVAIYFSAHWCGPCRQFTPKLLELYAQCKAQNKRFEVVFCSADHTEHEFRSYHASMTWPAIDYEQEHREGIMGMFKVSGIPRLTVLAANGKVLVENAIAGAGLTTSTVDQWIQMSDASK